jgi:hypothetical protein
MLNSSFGRGSLSESNRKLFTVEKIAWNSILDYKSQTLFTAVFFVLCNGISTLRCGGSSDPED